MCSSDLFVFGRVTASTSSFFPPFHVFHLVVTISTIFPQNPVFKLSQDLSNRFSTDRTYLILSFSITFRSSFTPRLTQEPINRGAHKAKPFHSSPAQTTSSSTSRQGAQEELAETLGAQPKTLRDLQICGKFFFSCLESVALCSTASKSCQY